MQAKIYCACSVDTVPLNFASNRQSEEGSMSLIECCEYVRKLDSIYQNSRLLAVKY